MEKRPETVTFTDHQVINEPVYKPANQPAEEPVNKPVYITALPSLMTLLFVFKLLLLIIYINITG